jgi:hypothetical protein
MGPGCLRGAPAEEFVKWVHDDSNPAHNRYMKMLANNTHAPALRRAHNCIIGNEAASMAVWGGRYGMKQGGASAPRTRAELWRAVNSDEALFSEVLGVLDQRFWFVGVLEELDLSMAVFCALGVCGGNKPLATSKRQRFGGRRLLGGVTGEEEASASGGRRSLLQKHSSKPVGFKLDPQVRQAVAAANKMDERLYAHVRARLHAAAAAHIPSDLAKLAPK